MSGVESVYGLISTVVGGGCAVVVAWLAAVRRDPAQAADPADVDAVAGIAAVVARQGLTITQQDNRIRDQDRVTAALRRYVARLQGALRSVGAPVPDPEPDDAPLIRR